MSPAARLTLTWTPRVLALVFAAFIAVFALDALSEDESVSATSTSLAMHLVPEAIILGAASIAWRWPIAGGLVFLLLGLAYAASTGRAHVDWILVIGGPLVMIGLLFVASAKITRVPTRGGGAHRQEGRS